MTLALTILLVLFLLQTKHLVIDWLWQPPYEFLNKGTYWHWGGIRHSLKNAVGTAVCFIPLVGLNPIILLMILGIDFLIHYHTDWGKMNIVSYFKWDMTKDSWFWYATGIDQYIHQVTYLGLVLLFIL